MIHQPASRPAFWAAVLCGLVLASSAFGQSPETRSKIEKEFEALAAKKKKVLTCTATVPRLFIETGKLWNVDRKHAKARLEKAKFDPTFVAMLMQKTDPDKMVNGNLRIKELIKYCAGVSDLINTAISGRRLEDVLDDANVPQ